MADTVVLPSSTTSTLSLSLHPLPILNISEHLTRQKLQKRTKFPFVVGALLGTQNGREVEIVNTFELAADERPDESESGSGSITVDREFLVSRTQQYKQVFPSLELIGWYTVAPEPTPLHINLHEQFTEYTATPLLLLLQPSSQDSKETQGLPFKAYEPTLEIRDRKSRAVFIEASYTVETGEAERIAVDWTARGGEGGSSLLSHLQTQRAAIKMLHDRIQVLVSYVTSVISDVYSPYRTLEGKAPNDHATLRSLSALLASLPASEQPEFREEFDTEYADVQLTAYLAALTKSTNALNDLVDKHVLITTPSRDHVGSMPGSRRRGPGRPPVGGYDWDRTH
ncbi:maintenance of mitochondrial structure and function-domain-containing protein [Gautieria morchelliformis]|nr:maintenance of mitochondrial structure and function-domain-containing protein [Gautieria morchelliformis]